MMQVTAHDVAKAAGVSQITVSRAFSGKAPVAEQTRQRILRAAERLGYRPNTLAAGLRGGHTTSVGALWSFEAMGGDASIGLEVLRQAQLRGYATYQAEHPYETEATCQLLADWGRRRLDAVLIRWRPGMLGDRRIWRALEAFRAVVAVVPEAVEGFTGDQVVHDRCAAMAEVARHFVRTGRRRPVLAITRRYFNESKERAFLAAWEAEGRAVEEVTLVDLEVREGERLIERYRRSLAAAFPDRLDADAIFCTSDEGAMLATRFVQQRGLRVPEDVAVVGFNDSEVCELWTPPLASVDRRREAVAQRVEELLFRRLAEPDAPPQVHRVPMWFVERESAG